MPSLIFNTGFVMEFLPHTHTLLLFSCGHSELAGRSLSSTKIVQNKYFLFFSDGNRIGLAGFGRTAILALHVLSDVGEPIVFSVWGEFWVPDQPLTLHKLGRVNKLAKFIFCSYKSTIISITGKEFLSWIDGRGLGSDFSALCSIADYYRALKLVGLNLYISPVL